MDWQNKILSQFVQNAGTKVWVVSDPDGLVRNEQILGQLQGRGFECLFFEDPIEFRYEYESRIRRAWERGDELPLIILFDERIDGFNALPSDVLASACQMEFGVSSIFPQCDTDVVRQIPVGLWGQLSNHLKRTRGKSFGKRDTEELVLRVCYRLSAELIDSTAEFYRKLFDLHLHHDGLPVGLAARFEEDLRLAKGYDDIDVSGLCSDRQNFWRYLTEEWRRFLDAQLKGNALEQAAVPFDNPLLRGYISKFIDSGHLEVIEAAPDSTSENAWWSIGFNTSSDTVLRLCEKDLDLILSAVPDEGANSRDWIDFAIQYSRTASELFCEPDQKLIKYFWSDVWAEVDTRFFKWLKNSYSGLHNLPASPPVMQHHIPKQLNRLRAKGARVALVLLDGMSLAGWNTILPVLKSQMKTECRMDTSGVFSWLPSLTPICRQAAFSGLAPRLFEATIDRTDRDGARWKEFWEANGELRPSQITHLQHKGDLSEAQLASDMLERSIAIGLTVEKPDKIMHGASLGWTGWHQQIQLWATSGYLAQLIDQLISAEFTVCITADHGNLEARGTGRISEGVLAQSRGQRTRIYGNDSLRDATLFENPDAATSLQIATLPGPNHALYAKGRGAFVTKGEVIVTHGGASIDEMIVPWVTIEGNKK